MNEKQKNKAKMRKKKEKIEEKTKKSQYYCGRQTQRDSSRLFKHKNETE